MIAGQQGTSMHYQLAHK